MRWADIVHIKKKINYRLFMLFGIGLETADSRYIPAQYCTILLCTAQQGSHNGQTVISLKALHTYGEQLDVFHAYILSGKSRTQKLIYCCKHRMFSLADCHCREYIRNVVILWSASTSVCLQIIWFTVVGSFFVTDGIVGNAINFCKISTIMSDVIW